MSDNVQPIDDVKAADRRKINALKVKALSEDGAFWLALLLAASSIYPPIGEWVTEHREALAPLCLVLAGHFGVRMVSAKSVGNVLTSDARADR